MGGEEEEEGGGVHCLSSSLDHFIGGPFPAHIIAETSSDTAAANAYCYHGNQAQEAKYNSSHNNGNHFSIC